MAHILYKIIQHDGGWAYTVDGVFSEPFPNHDAARTAAHRAALEQRVPGRRRTTGDNPPWASTRIWYATAFAKNFRRSDFGAGLPNSVFQRARSPERSRSGNRAISASRAASSTDLRFMDQAERREDFLADFEIFAEPIR
jgi:hypothetical protein